VRPNPNTPQDKESYQSSATQKEFLILIGFVALFIMLMLQFCAPKIKSFFGQGQTAPTPPSSTPKLPTP